MMQIIRERATAVRRFLIDAQRSVALSATFVVILIAGLDHAIVESWMVKRKREEDLESKTYLFDSTRL